MPTKLKYILRKIFPSLCAYRFLILKKNSYIHKTGWLESFKKVYPCKIDGSELPWMNYPIIHLLEQRLTKEMSLFEYGSGFSTLFYANHVKDVTSVEYDKHWYEKIKEKIPNNVKLIYQEKDQNGDYCRTIQSNGKKYDLVIVDGRDRVNCIKQSIEALSDQGIIILDDSDREKYSEGIQYAKDKGFLTLDFEGLKPTRYELYMTTIIYRKDNCFNI